MRILKVNDRTVRIFISFTELQDHNISLVDFFQRSSRTEQFFWDLITKVRDEVDFTLDQPFWIQATVASEDEFVITVIKQEDQIEAEINHILQTTLGDKKKESRPSSKFASGQDWVYVFADLEDVISAVKVLPEIFSAVSSLYSFEDEYYLAMSEISPSRKKKVVEAIMDEFGEAIMTSAEFLREHGEVVIAENAIKILKKLGK